MAKGEKSEGSSGPGKSPEGKAQGRKPGKVTEYRKVEMAFSAPEATEVFVAGDFNFWDPLATPMKRHKEGTWKAKLRLRPGRYEYKFLVDGQWVNYVRGVERVPNPFGTENMVLWVD
jgi:1,4-alpha-glucan branching enzyme